MSRYKEMNTEPLINEMVSLCLEVPPELAQEIASREDAISYLRDILQNEKYWNHGGPGDAWAPYHVIYITSLRGRTWWRNLRRDVKISMHLQGKDLETYGEVIEDRENIEEQLMRHLQKLPQYVRYFKASLDPEGHPDPDDVAQTAKERVMILLRLE